MAVIASGSGPGTPTLTVTGELVTPFRLKVTPGIALVISLLSLVCAAPPLIAYCACWPATTVTPESAGEDAVRATAVPVWRWLSTSWPPTFEAHAVAAASELMADTASSMVAPAATAVSWPSTVIVVAAPGGVHVPVAYAAVASWETLTVNPPAGAPAVRVAPTRVASEEASDWTLAKRLVDFRLATAVCSAVSLPWMSCRAVCRAVVWRDWRSRRLRGARSAAMSCATMASESRPDARPPTLRLGIALDPAGLGDREDLAQRQAPQDVAVEVADLHAHLPGVLVGLEVKLAAMGVQRSGGARRGIHGTLGLGRRARGHVHVGGRLGGGEVAARGARGRACRRRAVGPGYWLKLEAHRLSSSWMVVAARPWAASPGAGPGVPPRSSAAAPDP